eukprot:TRINITY_DN13256_c0_g1_i1.p2 TRINITY_DN13256_c0_g1~~TRINITY_DN13256_c0_g1_i1.p2  ORF type:complete len:143 (-),score=17.92 TRINITY_DN13256_c0_g1_i1:45-473(-)
MQQQQESSQNDQSTNILKGNSFNFLCQNIPQYCGKSELWDLSKNIGIFKKNNQIVSNVFESQKINDKKLEFLTFKSSNSKIANRVAQGQGPFILKFQQDNPETSLFQIDGDYYKMHKPKFCLIYQTRKIKNGQIIVMNNYQH